MKTIESFITEREQLNKIILSHDNKNIKRFFHIDHAAYQEGALPAKTKELLGLVASLVLRCDDCITYHVLQCKKADITDQELEEAVSIGLIVGGSIVIPHLRRVYALWEDIKKKE